MTDKEFKFLKKTLHDKGFSIVFAIMICRCHGESTKKFIGRLATKDIAWAWMHHENGFSHPFFKDVINCKKSELKEIGHLLEKELLNRIPKMTRGQIKWFNGPDDHIGPVNHFRGVIKYYREWQKHPVETSKVEFAVIDAWLKFHPGHVSKYFTEF